MSRNSRQDDTLDSLLSTISTQDKKLTENLQLCKELAFRMESGESGDDGELRGLCEALMSEIRDQNSKMEDLIVERDEYKCLVESLMQVECRIIRN